MMRLVLIEGGADVRFLEPNLESPLFYILSGESVNMQLLQFLFQLGMNPNAQTNKGITPLHTFLSSSDLKLQVVEFLVENGADVSIVTNEQASVKSFHFFVGETLFQQK